MMLYTGEYAKSMSVGGECKDRFDDEVLVWLLWLSL